jgi:hypothetical protein
MAPEMLSVKQHNEQELAQLADDVEEHDVLATTAEDAAGQVLMSRKGPDGLMAQGINSPKQNEHSVDSIPPGQQHTQQYEGIQKSQLGLLGRAESPFQQQQQQQQESHSGARHVLQQSAHLDSSKPCSPENQALMMDGVLHQSSCSRVSDRCNLNVNAMRAAGWEQPDYYDEKVDIWQVGCVIHELLCGSMPFEVGTKPLLLLLLLLLMMMMMMMIDC